MTNQCMTPLRWMVYLPAMLVLTACSSQNQAELAASETTDLTLEQTAQQAQLAHARTRNIDPSEIEILDARAVTWSDSAVGCPRPGVFYTQMLVEGYRVVISVNGEPAYYHSARGRLPFLCPEDRRNDPIKMGRTIY